jgi:hypothetical protein
MAACFPSKIYRHQMARMAHKFKMFAVAGSGYRAPTPTGHLSG